MAEHFFSLIFIPNVLRIVRDEWDGGDGFVLLLLWGLRGLRGGVHGEEERCMLRHHIGNDVSMWYIELHSMGVLC